VATAAAVGGIGGGVEALVDRAVAVVVGRVAALGAGVDAAILAAVGGAAVEVDEAEVARRDGAGTERAALDRVRQAARRAAAAVQRIVLLVVAVVDRAVAVVVEVVARLGAAAGRADAEQHAVLALGRAGHAHAGVGAAAGAAAGVAVVDRAVAVVVDAVAALDPAVGRRALVLAEPGTAASTSTNPGSHIATSHTPAWQSALAWSRLQTLPHRPQLFSSVARLKSSSIRVSQSLSRSSQTSTPPLVGMQKYSQPAIVASVSFQPGWHAPGVQVPMSQVPNACGYVHCRPHTPQLLGSACRLKPLSTTVSQSSTAMLHTSVRGTQLAPSIGASMRRRRRRPVDAAAVAAGVEAGVAVAAAAGLRG
jgi:hypothetical protein